MKHPNHAIILFAIGLLILLTGCSATPMQKIEKGDALTADDYAEMISYANNAFRKLREITDPKYDVTTQDAFVNLSEAAKQVAEEYPEAGTYMVAIDKAARKNNPQLKEAAESDIKAFRYYSVCAGRWGVLFPVKAAVAEPVAGTSPIEGYAPEMIASTPDYEQSDYEQPDSEQPDCGQPEKVRPVDNATSGKTTHVYTGTIGDYKIRMTLQLSGSTGDEAPGSCKIKGSYVYTDNGTRLTLNGEERNDGEITLNERDRKGRNSGRFDLRRTSGGLTGTFTNLQNGNTFPVTLRPK